MLSRTLAIIKPGLESKRTEILFKISTRFTIHRIIDFQMTDRHAREFYKHLSGEPFFEELVKYMTSGPSTIMILFRENAISEWRNWIGPTDPKECELKHLRYMYGGALPKNAFHGSVNKTEAEREIKFFFGKNV